MNIIISKTGYCLGWGMVHGLSEFERDMARLHALSRMEAHIMIMWAGETEKLAALRKKYPGSNGGIVVLTGCGLSGGNHGVSFREVKFWRGRFFHRVPSPEIQREVLTLLGAVEKL